MAGVLVWGGLAGLGVRATYRYSTDEGAQIAAPPTWPTTSLPHQAGRAELVMFVHPDCPCSRASIAELADVSEVAPTTTQVVVAFVGDEAGEELWNTVGKIPRVRRVVDRGGVEARRFGALTSGHVVVYDAAGVVRFQGGITGSRGHVGDNVGRRQVIAILSGDTVTARHAVFGCGLHDVD